MARKFVNFCVVFALLTGCWGGVLAAAACPHLGCETAAAVPDVHATHGGHTDGHDAVSTEGHSGHAGGHEGQDASPPSPYRGPAAAGHILSGGHDPGCTHCVGRPETPPSPRSEWQSNFARKGGGFVAPLTPARVEAPAAVSLREIRPAQHAPPGSSARHLLLNIFRI